MSLKKANMIFNQRRWDFHDAHGPFNAHNTRSFHLQMTGWSEVRSLSSHVHIICQPENPLRISLWRPTSPAHQSVWHKLVQLHLLSQSHPWFFGWLEYKHHGIEHKQTTWFLVMAKPAYKKKRNSKQPPFEKNHVLDHQYHAPVEIHEPLDMYIIWSMPTGATVPLNYINWSHQTKLGSSKSILDHHNQYLT